MLASSLGGSVLGINGHPIEVEVDVSPGLPGFNIVGLPEGAVRESRERVKAAIKNCGYSFPTQKITVNLAPADMKKEGSGLDLPIACAILAAQKVVPQEALDNYCFYGELALDGRVKPCRGVLPLSLSVRNWEVNKLMIPRDNALEAGVVEGVEAFAPGHLSQLVEHLVEETELERVQVRAEEIFSSADSSLYDFQDVIGQDHAKRALEVASAGGHNCLMSGPPGSGKTMLARCLPSILPPLSFEEALETTSIYSVAGMLPKDQPFITTRPFCSPHHTISDAGLIGGGASPRPGQVSLAHNGILFLDELPEFKKNVLEGLRQPLEDGMVQISRAASSVSFPSRFSLIAAMNPCPCGKQGDVNGECTCSAYQVDRYRGRISGPLLDRIDIRIEVPALAYEELGTGPKGEPSSSVRERVSRARQVQEKRFIGTPLHCNAQMTAREIPIYCGLGPKEEDFCLKISKKLGLSARSYHRMLKIARTIADLEGSEEIGLIHLSEAAQYRGFETSDPWQ